MRSLLALTALALTGLSAAAQTFPNKPITMIVPFAAGGPTDTVARIISETMTRDLGQTIVVENAGGAGGTIGSGRVANAKPDGYTVLLHHIGISTAPTLYRKLPFDTKTAFEGIGLVKDVPMTLVSKPELPAATLADVLAYVKAKKQDASLANAGLGAASHLCGMMFMSALQTPMTTVPYKGTGPAMNDVLGNRVDLMCDQTTNTTSQIKAGKIKVFAVTTPQRIAILPDTPTTAEAGLPGLAVTVWHGLYAPKGTPQAVVDRLAASLQKALADENVKERFAQLGTTPVPLADATPAAARARLDAEIDRWAPIIKAAGEFAD